MDMTTTTLSPAPAIGAERPRLPKSAIKDDMVMIRAASELTRDLVTPKPAVYWADFLLSALIGYVALAGAVTVAAWPLALASGIVAVMALYRAGAFIHEIAHLRGGAVPHFRLVWNALAGVPLLMPSFMYEGIHSLHHNRTKYGTVEDPEYLPLALMKPWTVPMFVAVSALAPIAFLLRYGVLTPLSLPIPPLRRLVVERYSGLIINPAFRRRRPEGPLRGQWFWQEAAACLWSLALIAATATGLLPLRGVLIFLAVVAGSMVLNQVRTLVAHLWENDGDVLTVTGQFLDSVNVPPPGLLPELWAPVGLRYHAIHHLLPGLPYHALPEAHRRLVAALPVDSQYHCANRQGLPTLVLNLMRGAGRA